ncbi:MAG: chemotaxis response regulator protein-glutamate methylesterase [Anaerolineae bacterium]
MIRVLIVDDSAFMRVALTRMLGQDPEIQVVGTARDGVEALEQIEALRPDVLTLDVEMPRMNGLELLSHLMQTRPLPVIMLSSLTQEGAEVTIQALTLGAVDFVPKPDRLLSVNQVAQEVIDKVKRAATARVSPMRQAGGPSGTHALLRPGAPRKPALDGVDDGWEKLVVIGSSTGGPRALRRVLSELPGDLPAAFLIVQHMPVGFTRSLAATLDQNSSLLVREARVGDVLERGVALVAPGGYHLIPDRRGRVQLDRGPTVNGVRPAVDVTLISAAGVYGPRMVVAILTGMGHDGTDGARAVKSAGGIVVAEHESSCVVYGMPRSVIEAGLADRVVPLDEMAGALVELIHATVSNEASI